MPLIEDSSPLDLATEHWRTFMQDFRPCNFPGFPDDRPSADDGFQKTTVKSNLEKNVIQEFCRRNNLTPNSLFQSAWAIVINRYAGVEDVSFGCYTAREGDSSASQHLDYPFVSRVQITSQSSLGHTMLGMKRDSDKALEHHGRLSITEIQKLIGLNQPLFNAALLVQECGDPSNEPKDYDIIARVLTKNGTASSVSIYTRRSKFSAEQSADIAHTYEQTISQCARAHFESTIDDIDLFSKRDYEKVMRWNNKKHNSVEDTFHQLFEKISEKTPDASAICSWDGNYTYRELDAASTKVANYLAELGVVRETLVLLCFDKSAFAIISMLGIMKAGGAFVAIDPTYPASRILAIQQATNSSIALTERAHGHIFEEIMSHVVVMSPESVAQFPTSPKFSAAKSDFTNAAYVVFTSGSTGSPKGVVVEHRALCTAALSLATPMNINSESRHLNFAAFTFDLSYGDIFVTLAQGACLCLPSEHERVNDLVGAMVRMNVNSACLIPSIARLFRPEDVPKLKTLSLGGEALVKENLELWASKVTLNNMYGPSECTIWCCSNMNLKTDTPANNIGRGVGALLWIVSPTNHNHLCPIGCIGELLIEGPVMARGYLNPEQTKKSFTENPSWAAVSTGQRRRFYKTGDLVKYNPDGTVSFIGRKDTQVKFNGRRIETGEIEYHLASHDLPRQSMVILPSTGIYAKKLVAVIVLKSSPIPKESTGEVKAVTGTAENKSMVDLVKIRTFLSSKVPYYMLPQFWMTVEEIPLMISGKMNRVVVKKYVEGLVERIDQETKTQKPTTVKDFEEDTESRLQKVWGHVLNRETANIGVKQSFGSLGGDSFSAMEIVALCRTEGFDLAVRDFRESSTIQELVSVIESRLLKNGSTGGNMCWRAIDHSTLSCATLPLPPVWWR